MASWRYMEQATALEDYAAGFAALGHPARLKICRLLVEAGPDGMTVGALQSACGAAGSTLFHHLKALTESGLVGQRRAGREVRCRISAAALDDLAALLVRALNVPGIARGALAAPDAPRPAADPEPAAPPPGPEVRVGAGRFAHLNIEPVRRVG